MANPYSYLEWQRQKNPYAVNNTTFYGGDSERGRNAYQEYLASLTGSGQGGLTQQDIAKLLNPENPYAPTTKEHTFYEKLLKGEKTQEARTAALDKEIRGVYSQMLLDSGQPDQLALSDINRSEQSDKAGAFQSLAGRGLGNTTVVDAVQRQIGEGAQRQRVGVYDQAKRQKTGVQSMYANYLNSISNNGPDPSIYANLLTGNAAQGGKKNNTAGDFASIMAAMGLFAAAV